MSSAPTVVATGAPATDASAPRVGLRNGRLLDVLVFVVPTIAYLILILTGATTSSIGIDSLRQDPQHPVGIHIGGSQSIRSDEFGTGSPMWIGQIVRNGESAASPLSVDGGLFTQNPSGPVSSVVFFESSAFHLARVVPAEMLFAMKWWLPTYLLFLGLPVLFRQIIGSLRWGYLAAALVALSPATVWWSGIPVNTLGFVSAGCALAVFGARALARRRWWASIAGFAISGLLLARTPTYYQPTAIVVGLPIVLMTAIVILTDRARLRDRLVSLAAASVSGIVWTAALFWESRDAIVAGLGTVYPGLRQSSGQALDPGFVFGATDLGWLRFQTVGPGSNQSEITTSYVALTVALVIVLARGRLGGGSRMRWIVLALAAPAVFWLSWALVSWGEWSAALPLINRVPASRAAMGAGYLAVIGLCLALARYDGSGRRRMPIALAAGLSTAVLSAWGGVALETTGLLRTLAPWMIALSAIIGGAVVFSLLFWPRRIWPMFAAGAAALAVTITAQPVIFGLGDLHASSTARQFLSWGSVSRADRTLWASDSQPVDSLLAATAVPSLTYRQQIGPDRPQWAKLDPTGANQTMWNRGGTHIAFAWAPSGITFEQPYADTIIVRASPCEVHARIPRFQHLVSSRPLAQSCLVKRAQIPWSGRTQYVYDIVTAP